MTIRMIRTLAIWPRSRQAEGFARELSVGGFGLIPYWSKDVRLSRSTYNCWSEAGHEGRSINGEGRRLLDEEVP